MGIFNDNLDAIMRRNSVNSPSETPSSSYAIDNKNTCPSCCTLITSSNNSYYSNIDVAKEFEEKVLVHVVSQYMNNNELFTPPLYLAIEGPAGEGKTTQTIATLTQHDIDVLYVSASEISGSHEGESVGILNSIYEFAIHRNQNNHCIAILIDDFHMGAVNQDNKIEKTINSNLLTGRMMNLADNSNENKIPIIMTGNDFSTVYAPLLRSGRADVFIWNPDILMKTSIIKQILSPFVMLGENEYFQFCHKFAKGTISDFSQLRNDFRKKYVWEMIENESSLNMDAIIRLNKKRTAFRRLTYSELCDLAEKRISPISIKEE